MCYFLGGGVAEAKELLKNLIQSECRLVDNNLLHSDRQAAYEAASDLMKNMQDTQEEQISKRIERKFPGNGSRTKSGTREPRSEGKHCYHISKRIETDFSGNGSRTESGTREPRTWG